MHSRSSKPSAGSPNSAKASCRSFLACAARFLVFSLGVFAERTRGRLAPGYKADLVLLDQDLTRIPPEAIERAAVRATVVGGRVVYEAK